MKKVLVIGVVAIGIVAIFLLLLVPSVSATWCDANYGKKAPILINNTGGSAQTYYQVELNYSFDGDMNANFSDARVYNESDCSLIPLWNESAVASSWNRIWFNATNIPASSWTNDTYYLYYNYSSASSVSNITTTFLFGDDFPGESEVDKGRWFDQKYSSNPIISPDDGSAGIDDVGTAWGYFMTNGTNDYRMYYTGIQEEGGRDYDICLATSTDGQTWTRTTEGIDGTHKVIDDDGGGSAYGAWAGPVWKEDSTYYMIYKKDISAVYYWYLVNSTDGISWNAAQQVNNDGREISSLMKIGNVYWAWASSGSPSAVYYYNSTDLKTWTIQNGGSSILSISGYNVVCPDVFYNVDDSTYYMAAAVTPYGAGDPEKYYGTYRLWNGSDLGFSDKQVVGDLLIGDADTLPYLETWEKGIAYDGQHFIWANVSCNVSNSDNMFFYYSAEAVMDSVYNFSQGLVMDTVGDAITNASKSPPPSALDANKWTEKANADTTISNDVLSLGSTDGGSSGIYTKAYNHSADGVIIEYQGKRGTSNAGTRIVGSMSDVDAMHKGAGGLAYYASTQGVKCWNYAGTSNYPEGTINDIFYDMIVYLKPTEIVVTGAGLTATVSNTLLSYPVLIGCPGADPWYIKNFRVRKYASPEPTASLGTEESPSVTYTPPNPTNLQHTDGNFWVNYTLDAGTGNVTNSYNVSNATAWINGSSNTYFNESLEASEWLNITVYAYNSSGDGTLSAGSVSDQQQAPSVSTKKLYETSTSDFSAEVAVIDLYTSRDGTANNVAYTLATGNLYNYINATSNITVGNDIKIPAGTKVNFSAYFDDGDRVDYAYVTWKFYRLVGTSTTLICQKGDDSTGGVQIPDGTTETITGYCSVTSDVTLNSTDKVRLIMNVWAETIGGGGSATKVATHYWDSTHESWVEYKYQLTTTDTTFTVSLPVGYTKPVFEPPNSTATNYPPNGQTSSQEFFNVTNSGNVNLDVRMRLNTTVSTITLKADADNNPTGADTIGTSLVTIHSNLGQGSSANIWLWSDFDHTPAQTANRTVYINVSQS